MNDQCPLLWLSSFVACVSTHVLSVSVFWSVYGARLMVARSALILLMQAVREGPKPSPDVTGPPVSTPASGTGEPVSGVPLPASGVPPPASGPGAPPSGEPGACASPPDDPESVPLVAPS